MRVMIFGDVSTGKSTFAQQLSKKLSLPVIHLDEIMKQIGREDRENVGKKNKSLVDKKNWVMDGNAFTKDKEYRIRQADQIIVFDASPWDTFAKHLMRWSRIRLGLTKAVGGHDDGLNLVYYVPYIFFKFPERKKAAILLAESLGKKVIIIKNREQAKSYLSI